MGRNECRLAPVPFHVVVLPSAIEAPPVVPVCTPLLLLGAGPGHALAPV